MKQTHGLEAGKPTGKLPSLQRSRLVQKHHQIKNSKIRQKLGMSPGEREPPKTPRKESAKIRLRSEKPSGRRTLGKGSEPKTSALKKDHGSCEVVFLGRIRADLEAEKPRRS